MRILLVEDDPTLGNALSRSLRQAGYAVDWAEHGQAADLALHDQVYEAVVLDLGLPKIDGFEVLRRLRGRKLTTPVIILTARDALEDRIKGLDLGADDYLIKPFKLPELEARLRALIRRSHAVPSSAIHYGPLTLDTKDHMVAVAGEPLALSSRELNVLETLLLRAGRVVSKDGLL